MKREKKVYVPLLASLVLGLGGFGSNVHGNTINFNDLALPNAGSNTQYAPDNTTVTGYYWNGPDSNGTSQPDGYGGTQVAGQFTSGGASFNNIYDGGYWSGWSYSNVNDTTTAGYGNQYAAVTGGGMSAGSNYAVGYDAVASDAGSTSPTITLPSPTTVASIAVTNTTYAYLSMLNGDSFAKKFTSTDWFKLEISGLDASGQSTGTPVDIYLADNGSIVNTWQSVNLTSLGNDVSSLVFSLSSTDTGEWGMNTPAYFAVGELVDAPEPASLGILTLAGVVVLSRRRTRRLA